jgi:ribosome maturation factor RimP
MTQSSPTLQGIDRSALERIVEPIVRAHGAEVVDLEYRREREGWVLRVMVERAGSQANNLSTRDAAIGLDLCAEISRDLSPALDVVDIVPNAYHLEVGSPGVERKLRGERDFVRFAGQKAKLRLRDPVDGPRVVVGTLGGVADGRVRVTDGSRTHELPLGSVESARLVFELFANPKGANTTRPGGAAPHLKQTHKHKKH